MAAFVHVRDMNDVALRPRLLRRIVREHVPDEKRPFGSPSQLSKVISMVKTHGLLFESAGDRTADQKLLAGWRSAVDSWLDRLLLLVSNDMPDKCWAGICLLGVTCQECSSDRFLASCSIWFQKLLSHIQLPEASHFVKVASCASMSDLLTRLGGFPNTKKDGNALAARVIQPVLKLLSEGQSEATWDGAVHLLCTIITFFPFSVSRHYETVEAAIVSKFLSGNCSLDMLKKLAYCLALLPKSRGDEESWSLMMHKILLCINTHLNDTFQGFEEDNISHETVRLLVRPGKDLPPPFGEILSPEEPSSTRKRSETLTTSSISALMLCCCTMLTSSFPVQVTVPVRSLLLLVERVLMANGSLPDSQRAFVTAMQQEFLSSELPILHQCILELLTAIIKSVRSQILPHAASIVRLISVYFKKCALPELRTKMYSITKMMLISMGVGMAVCLAEEVVNNAFVDLSPVGFWSGGTSSRATTKPSTEVLPPPSRKKRKHGATTNAPEEGHNGISLEVGALKNPTPILISLRIAALEAVEALLTVGGALRSEGWRSNLDLLLINIAKSSLQEGWASEERNVFHAGEPSEIQTNMQLAALRALLASFLSSRVRSSYLAQGLELFREGKQETGSKLAEFCAHALLTMEVLIHPRTLQAVDFPAANCFPDEVEHKFPENNFPGNLNYGTMQGMGHNVHDPDQDDLCDSWLESGKEPEVTVSDPIEKPSETLTIRQDIKLSGDAIAKEMSGRNADSEIRRDGDVVMPESDRLYESVRPNQNSVTPTNYDGSAGAKMVSERITSDIGSSKPVVNNLASDEELVLAKADGGFTVAGASATSIIPDKGKELSGEMDNESDMEEDFPDIVVADPDSDYE